VEWLLVAKKMMCIYNCRLGIEMNDMYDARIDMNHVAEIDDCDVGCCPMGPERLMKVLKNRMSRELM